MDNIKRTILPIITFAKIDVKRLFRDKVGIFFVFLFPLIFLIIFGSIFNSDTNVSFRVALINQSSSEFSKEFEKQVRDADTFEVDEESTTLDLAREKMDRGQITATIVLPDTFGNLDQSGKPTGTAEIQYNQTNEQAGQTLASVMNGIFEGINNDIQPYQPPFTAEAKSTNDQGLSQFDYTFSGLLGFTLISLGIFGPTQVFPRMKQRGVLRRYHMTPIKVWQYFVANVLSNAFIGILAAGIMFTAAVTLFDLNMRGSYIVLALVTLLGTIMLYGIGLALGGWAKNENQAAPLAQLVTLPMMFLSGVFFPIFLMPAFLQSITQFIPLTPVIEAVRLTITENASLIDLAPQIGVMAGWTVIIYVIAFRVFRWE